MTGISSLGSAPMVKISTKPERRIKKKKLTFKEYFWNKFNIEADSKNKVKD